MATTAAKPEVFSRKASGLSRVMSPWSAFMYNFLTMGVIFPWTFVWAPAAFPGVSVWMACLSAILLELPIALAYVWMATAMPRSGGDYVFQSRVLGGAIGFPVVMSGFVHLDPAVGRARRLASRHPRRGAALHGARRALREPEPHRRRRLGAVVGQGVVDHQHHRRRRHGDPAGDRLQELRAPAVLHVRRHRHPRRHPARAVPAHDAGRVRRGHEPLLQRRRRPRGLLPAGSRRTSPTPASTCCRRSPSAPSCSPRRSCGRACSGPPTACSRAARSRAPACSRTRCSSSSAR